MPADIAADVEAAAAEEDDDEDVEDAEERPLVVGATVGCAGRCMGIGAAPPPPMLLRVYMAGDTGVELLPWLEALVLEAAGMDSCSCSCCRCCPPAPPGRIGDRIDVDACDEAANGTLLPPPPPPPPTLLLLLRAIMWRWGPSEQLRAHSESH